MMEWMDERKRAWLYRVYTAVAGLLVLLGILADDVAQQVLLIAAAVLATGEGVMAAAHTPARRE